MEGEAGPSRGWRYLPVAVLLVSGVVLALGWRDAEQRRAGTAQEQLDLEARRIATKLAERLDAYDEILRGGAGLFAASREVDRGEWRRYVTQLRLGEAYRGIQGVGFALAIPPDRLPAHEAEVRSGGFPDYSVFPPGPRDLYTSIVYLEPFSGRNLRAFGYDMWSEPVRRAAMERARDVGDVATSGMVKLVQETETDVQAGILTYMPVYSGGVDPGTVEGRRKALLGWTYSPLRMQDLVEGILGGELRHVRLRVYDDPKAGEDHLLYDSRPGARGIGLAATLPFETNGRRWTLQCEALPGFLAVRGPQTPWGDLWPLVIIALLLAGLSWALGASLRLRAREARLTATVRASEARYRSFFDDAPVGIFHLDAEGRFLRVNPRYCELTGFPERELLGTDHGRVIHPEDRAGDRQVVQAVGEGRRPTQTLERRRVRKDGSVFWGQVTYAREEAHDGATVTILGVLQDVTDRREAEERFRLIAERSGVAIGIVQDGRILYVNPAATELTGRGPEEYVGRELSALLEEAHPDDRERIAAAAAAPHPAADGSLLSLTYRIRRKDGEERLVQQSARPIQHLGRPALLFTAIDLTDRERLEEELRKAQRLESLALLAGGIAHDFNNLLTAVFGHVEVARSATPSGSAASGELAVALSALGRARDLTRQLLTFSAGGAPQRKVLAVPRLLADAASMGLGGSPVRARFEVASGLPAVDADEGQMSQLLNNLLINARQAMRDGGEVVLRARERAVADGELPELPAGRYVELEVVDHGHGIPAEILPRVFDPFFTTRETGTGLGLATCFSIVRRHGGHIGIASRPGEGTTVRVLLPVAGRPAEPPGPATAAAPRPGLRVLLMDDEPMLLKVGVKHLRALGCTVETAANGEEALALVGSAREAGRRFHVAILDLTVAGGMGGRATVEQLRGIDPSVVAVACSGYFEGGIGANPAAHGFQAVLAKPYLREDLSRVLGLVAPSD